MAYLAAILARAGPRREMDARRPGGRATSRSCCLRSSITRAKPRGPIGCAPRGVKVGFVGITASKMPELFVDHCDFILNGEPEAGVMRLAQGVMPEGIVDQRADQRSRLAAVSALGSGHRGPRPAARHPVVVASGRRRLPAAREPRLPGVLHLLPAPDSGRATAPGRSGTSSTKSSGCAISTRVRTSSSAIRCSREQRERCLELCDEIQARGLTFTFEAETRLDRLDGELLTGCTPPDSAR